MTVKGFVYELVPISPDHVPSCSGCGDPYHGPWRLGQALERYVSYLCGQPKQNGEPCRWDTRSEPCMAHPTPEQLERQRTEERAAQERRRQAEEDRQHETEQRRQGLIQILSVRCPQCSAPAASLCRAPKSGTVRTLHHARRKLAGTNEPKTFVIEATNCYTPRVAEPPLDMDPRALLDHPLEDRTAEATRRYHEAEQQAADWKMAAARRAVWLAAEDRTLLIRAQACPTCCAVPDAPCDRQGRFRNRFHDERTDAAMRKSLAGSAHSPAGPLSA